MRLTAVTAVIVCAVLALLGADFPRPAGWVADAAGVLTATEQQQIEAIAQNLKDSTGAELAVVTVVSTADMGSKMFAVELFEEWGIGQKGKDTGVLLLLVTGDERSVEIEVGYGLEAIIPDGAAGRILDEHVVPALRDGQSGKALIAGAQAIAERVQAGLAGELTDEPDVALRDGAWFWILAALGGMIVLAAVAARLMQRRCPECRSPVRTRQEVMQQATRLVAGAAVLHYACRKCGWTGTGPTVRIPPTGGYRGGPGPGGYGGGFGGGSGRSGGSRGGFGGFGGGRSGGGGAGRRW